MYIGHYAAAAALLAVAPETPVLPIAVAVAWPDVVWSGLVASGVEKVRVDPSSPLQSTIRFTWYPYSHSLVLSAALTLIPALAFGLIYQSAWVGIAFWLGAVSHWLLDVPVHGRDLPVLGRVGSRDGRGDRFVGWGLWSRPRLAFVAEYTFFALVALTTAPRSALVGLLAGALLLHLLNANSFFGFTRGNPTGTPRRYAGFALAGFAAAIAWFTLAWQ
ncbi:hypothetical protein RBS60_00425 [Sinomonas sp. ASV486]|uniref:hypothetical protein n=1 Tax=Sinomonas sp. ASV486 TaxID=3051170 RepID=UPI0027DE336A|nr:hypothetical protein [Sinomonas sp. ASV486]MDQ4488657.1 hypothetical protein [Sinomonas sp. ASV486]